MSDCPNCGADMKHSPCCGRVDTLRAQVAQLTKERDEARRDAAVLFDSLFAAWLSDTSVVSSPSVILRHPYGRAIVSLGERAVPMLLRKIEDESGGLPAMLALNEITGANPVPAADRGNVVMMRQHWLKWGQSLSRHSETQRGGDA